MSLIAPLFLLGLLGIGLPLWLHRLQTQNPERRAVASAMLLEASERRLHVQKRLRFLLLLALRIALLACIALAFAQPLWKRPAGVVAARGAQLHLIVLDTSLSMSAGGRMAAARDAATRIIDGLALGERALLVSAGSTVTALAADGSAPTADKNALRRSLERVTAGEGRLEYSQAAGALDTLAGASTLPVTAHLISDFQASGLGTRFADLLPRSERGRRIRLQLHPVAGDAPVPNWAVTALRQSGADIDVTVQGHGTPARPLVVRLRVNDSLRGEQTQTVPADGEQVFHFASVPLNGGDNRVVAELASGDALPLDDRRYAVVAGGGPQAVPLLTLDARSATGTFVGAALSVSAAHYRASPTRLGDFDARTLERYRWVVVDDAGALDSDLAAQLRRYVESGGAVLLAAGARAAALQTLPVGGEAVRGVTVRTADPLLVGRVDAAHPALAGTGGWQSVSIARMLKLTPGANDRVLVAAEDGEPVLLEQRVGSGRLLILATGLDNVWSDLPVQPVFVAFMAQAAAWLAGESAYADAPVAGGLLQLAQSGAQVGQVLDPDGHELLSLAATHQPQNVRLARSGFYQLVTPGRETLLAVNVDARESDLAPADAALLSRWRSAAEAAEAVALTPASAQSSASSVPLAPMLLALLALVVLAESLAGNWLLSRNTKVQA
jgi:hypothetical protein